ncbi:hypothetical protein ONZ45_g7848 [Pleurotus djamor]|nr:hypothetical protein ONZ45_g7848 [Pleurotus djamor]
MDQMIKTTRDALRDLEQHRNACLSINSRIPTEVLSSIFEIMALSQSYPTYSFSSFRPYANWLSVTQVCRLWRTTALNSPRMWGCIYGCTKFELAQLFLKRSKSAPLYLRSTPRQPNPETIALLFSCRSRLKEVELRWPVEGWQELFASCQLPLLETISVEPWVFYPNCHLLGMPSGDPQQFQFSSDQIEGGTSPSLRHLKLKSCYVTTLKNPHLFHLRTLNIQSDVLSPGLPLIHVFDALANMPYLEELELVNVIRSSATVQQGSVVCLPHLRRLHLGVVDPKILMLISHLSCPSLQSIEAASIGVVNHEDLVFICQVFYQLALGISPSCKATLEVHPSMLPGSVWQSPTALLPSTLSSSFVITPDSDLNETGQPPPPSRLTVGARQYDYATAIALCNFIPLLRPTTLVLKCVHEAVDNGLINFLRHMVDVEELQIDQFETLVLILEDTPSRSGKKAKQVRPDNLRPFALPSLKRIIAQGNVQIKNKVRKLNKLKRLLGSRKAMNAGIELFSISSPYYNEGSFQVLESEVGTLAYVPYHFPISY